MNTAPSVMLRRRAAVFGRAGCRATMTLSVAFIAWATQSVPSSAQPLTRITCRGEFGTGSGMAGSYVGDSCLLVANTDEERTVQRACEEPMQCVVVGLGARESGKWVLRKVISAGKPGGEASPQSTITASRPPDDGMTWKNFESSSLGLRMLVMDAKDPTERMVLSVRGDWLDRTRTSDDAASGLYGLIRVLRKPADQPIEAAIEQAFVSSLSGEARLSCRAKVRIPPLDLGLRKIVLDIIPTAKYAQKIRARRQEGPDTVACGKYEGGGYSYFEYHPKEDPTRYLYISGGQEDPQFDERSLQFISAAPPAPRASSDGRITSPDSDLAAKVWTVKLNKAPGGVLFCEAMMRGRNAEASGDYAIRYRREVGSAPLLVVTYSGPRRAGVTTMPVELDERRLTALTVREGRMGRENTLVATLDTASFNPTVIAKLVEPSAFALGLTAGGRVFNAPVSGFSKVLTALDSCVVQLSNPR